MTRKKYNPRELSPCELRETNHHIDEIGQDEWNSTDCLFTGNECCEYVRQIKCPLRCLINLEGE